MTLDILKSMAQRASQNAFAAQNIIAPERNQLKFKHYSTSAGKAVVSSNAYQQSGKNSARTVATSRQSVAKTKGQNLFW